MVQHQALGLIKNYYSLKLDRMRDEFELDENLLDEEPEEDLEEGADEVEEEEETADEEEL
ncbi:MAG: hypothetical protein AAB449_00485 [Patescibacteria group bacterium]